MNKIGKPLSRLTKVLKKRKDSNKQNQKSKRSYLRHHRNTKDHIRILHATKFNNVEEIDKSLEIYSLSRLNQEELENRNILINSEGMETTTKNLLTSKSPEPDGFTCD